MAAIFSTLYEAAQVGYPLKTTLFTVTTSGDWFKMSAPGIIPLSAMVISTAASGFSATPYYAGVNVVTTVSTTTATSITYTGAGNPFKLPHTDFYIMTTGGEIMYCTHNSGYGTLAAGGGTFTVMRGCLGTTATTTGLTAASDLYIMNVIVVTSGTQGWPAVAGKVLMSFIELPSDPKAHMFPQA